MIQQSPNPDPLSREYHKALSVTAAIKSTLDGSRSGRQQPMHLDNDDRISIMNYIACQESVIGNLTTELQKATRTLWRKGLNHANHELSIFELPLDCCHLAEQHLRDDDLDNALRENRLLRDEIMMKEREWNEINALTELALRRARQDLVSLREHHCRGQCIVPTFNSRDPLMSDSATEEDILNSVEGESPCDRMDSSQCAKHHDCGLGRHDQPPLLIPGNTNHILHETDESPT